MEVDHYNQVLTQNIFRSYRTLSIEQFASIFLHFKKYTFFAISKIGKIYFYTQKKFKITKNAIFWTEKKAGRILDENKLFFHVFQVIVNQSILMVEPEQKQNLHSDLMEKLQWLNHYFHLGP